MLYFFIWQRTLPFLLSVWNAHITKTHYMQRSLVSHFLCVQMLRRLPGTDSTMFRMPSNADSLSPVLLLEFILWVPSFLTPLQPSQGAECQTTVPSAKPCLGNPDPKRFVLSGEWSLKATGMFVLSLTGQVNIWTDKPEGWSTGIFRPPILLKKNWMKVT